jgi:hypothetical protein
MTTVRPVRLFMLFYAGRRCSEPSDVVDVPDELATEWINNGWAVEFVPPVIAETRSSGKKGST